MNEYHGNAKHMRFFRIMTILAVACGFGLYIVALATRIDRFSWGLVATVLLNFMPYGLCLVLDRIMNRQVMAACSSLLLLTFDVWLLRDIIDAHSLSAIPVIFFDLAIPRISPLVKLIIILPIGCLVGLLVEKLCLGLLKSHPPGDEP